MKKIIIIAVVTTLVLSLGVVAYAANNNRTSLPENTKGEQLPAEEPRMDGEKTSDLPEMNGQSPRMDGEKPFGQQDMIDFDEMVKNGVISQETCDKIKAFMEENKPSDLPEMNGQPPQMDGQLPQMDGQLPQMEGEKPSDLPEMNGQPPQMDGEKPSDLPEMNGENATKDDLLDDLLSNGIITQSEYDALSEAIAK